MKLFSTNNPNHIVSLKEAVLQGLPPDNGLYVPCHFPRLEDSFINNLRDFSFQEIAYKVASTLFDGYIPDDDLRAIVYHAVNFPAPLVSLDDSVHILELFHGPSLAFKDFGARFMAQLMSYFDKDNDEKLTILVATSGDTGGAVASGFLNAEGIEVIILYPSGKVSHLQEKQLTTLGNNIHALEVKGTFDDCQSMVKSAFLDTSLNGHVRLSSANSINIARLIPQMFYYFEGFKQLNDYKNAVFCVPSGNFGNLTAGLYAYNLGLPIKRFIAATNSNDIVPSYLSSGVYTPKPSVSTISNAMDVGNPSNFARMNEYFCSTWNNFKDLLSGYGVNEAQTYSEMKRVYDKYAYVLDPHTAVGTFAANEYLSINPNDKVIVLETAHPSKFIDTVESAINTPVSIPTRLKELENKEKVATLIDSDYTSLKRFLLNR